MSHPLADFEQRQAALNPLASFCVSAPAGSGKTELLIQRYLTLLARVERPEQVLAITFTRKAAAEMLARVIAALDQAREEPAPTDQHTQQTWRLARAVLAADSKQNWCINDNPTRLVIRTIDSFCASLTRQMPILSGLGGAVTPQDNNLPAYREATRSLLEMLAEASPLSEDLGKLLLHFDGRWNRLEELLINMLACRDQWLVYMGTGLTRERAQATLEHSVELVIEDNLQLLATAIEPYRCTVLPLLQYAQQQLELEPCSVWPGARQGDLSCWLEIAQLLLTAAGEWRKTVNKNQGFPAGKGEAAEQKQAHGELVAELAGVDGLLELLVAVRYLPNEVTADTHWQLVLACSRLLPILAAQLAVVYQQTGQVDHTQIALAALAALGDDDSPTELALKLDYNLAHILVDEFQDTAVNQYELIRRLTRGWMENNAANPENPRTLFIVGDGMQSIYGFRDADVGLFMRARERGFNGVPLLPLDLQSNFRSDAQLVEWVNSSFAQAFPRVDNIQHGEVAFSPAHPERAALQERPVSLCGFADDEDNPEACEASWMCDRIEEGLRDPACQSIAVLVRARSHLLPIVAELKRRKLSWQAQDIDSLAQSAVVRDLQTLCRALHNHFDRVAWLALLRAPWCGIGLADLLVIAQAAGQGSVWQALTNPPGLAGLSNDAQVRVEHLVSAIDQAMSLQQRRGLRDWIAALWLQLGGPAACEHVGQLADAAEFLALLEQMDNAGECYDEEQLNERVKALFANSASAPGKLQLMTLYKAKGLEFDWVFMPALSRVARAEQRELLLWGEHHGRSGEVGFMLAMDDQGGDDSATLYNYLHRQKQRKRAREATRLLYVGATRAAQRLFMSARLSRDEQSDAWSPPPRNSLLANIWQVFEAGMQLPVVDNVAVADADVVGLLRLKELPATPPLPVRASALGGPDTSRNRPLALVDPLARQIGTVVHLSLQRLSALSAAQLTSFDCSSLRDWWRALLRGLQVSEQGLGIALQRVEQALVNVLGDEQGRWVLAAEREQAASEYRLSSLRADGGVAEHIIDRTYIHQNHRWVVDYKSAVPELGQALEDFLAQQAENYKPQLQRYRELFMALESREVRAALYFTALPYWLELS